MLDLETVRSAKNIYRGILCYVLYNIIYVKTSTYTSVWSPLVLLAGIV